MAGAGRDARGKAARPRLLIASGIALVAACASMQPPPGGPPDPNPPLVVAVTPDSGSILDDPDGDLEFRYDEIVTEQNLANFVTVSPRHERIEVSWKRRAFTVKPDGGWYPDAVYTVTVLPGVTDLRNNRSDSTRVVVFSTGGPIPDTRVIGAVVSWEDGRVGARAAIEAIRLPDSLTYGTSADSIAEYELRHLPPGTYLLKAGIDLNNNLRVDGREAYDSITVVVGDAPLVWDSWAFRHDTTGPRLTSTTLLDSQAVALGFNQALDTAPAAPDSFAVWELPDSTRIGVDQILGRAVYDSLRTARLVAAQVAADSVARAAARDSLSADSLAVLDSLATADSLAAVADSIALAPPTDSILETLPDSTRAMLMLTERPALSTDLVILTERPLQPGTRYWIEAVVLNLLGYAERSGRFLVLPAAPDST